MEERTERAVGSGSVRLVGGRFPDTTALRGGEYSIIRMLLGLSVAGAMLTMAGDAPLRASLGTGGALLLAVGIRDRLAALLLLLLWLAAGAATSSVVSPEGGALVLALTFHFLMPSAPYGSYAALGRADPGGGWRISPARYHAMWALTAFWFVLRGLLYTPPNAGPAEAVVLRLVSLLLAVLAFRPQSRRLFIVIACLVDLMLGQASGSLIAVILPLLFYAMLVDPAWLGTDEAAEREWLFYDGDCGLCHGAVRLVIAEDPAARTFYFAPLGSTRFQEAVPPETRLALPDSIVVRKSDGSLLVRSDAVLLILRRLGGWWAVFATVGGLIPRAIRDGLYDGVARVRKRVFAKPAGACPLVPDATRARFAVN